LVIYILGIFEQNNPLQRACMHFQKGITNKAMYDVNYYINFIKIDLLIDLWYINIKSKINS
jgi:hypothetical protein